MEAESSSRDLLNRFAGISTDQPAPESSSELSLGLSLGGCFSSNPREKTNLLIRSSSISAYPNHFFNSGIVNSIVKEEAMNIHVVPESGPNVGQLKRASSLPVVGADEEYKKRKVLQTLKRLEAKRKRNEKRMNSLSKGEEAVVGSRSAARGLPPLSQASLGSAGSSGSGSASGSPQGTDNATKKIERRTSGIGELDMPCVSTKGNGPNGTKIEGFLYKYKKGEEVRIVCVCHGDFLTPAEFVRHAGGGNVDNPMRHIVVNKPSIPLV